MLPEKFHMRSHKFDTSPYKFHMLSQKIHMWLHVVCGHVMWNFSVTNFNFTFSLQSCLKWDNCTHDQFTAILQPLLAIYTDSVMKYYYYIILKTTNTSQNNTFYCAIHSTLLQNRSLQICRKSQSLHLQQFRVIFDHLMWNAWQQ